ncbi:MAG: NUDIX domain-containing protein [Candidatus Obscuribacterales bacterium]|nr:NUDIX domain-containing protein [Candidatus Obscuribacterales bacterium]
MNENNPWQTRDSKLIYENPWIKVREDSVVQPDGKPGIYGVVHFKNKAIGVLALEDDRSIYLVGQFRYPLNRYSWEIPEGGCPEGEDPLLAAQRELREETGLTASDWKLLGTAHLSNSVCDEEALWYLATGLTQQEASPEGTEELKVKKVSFNRAVDMAINGEITDSVSVMAITNLAILLQTDTSLYWLSGATSISTEKGRP